MMNGKLPKITRSLALICIASLMVTGVLFAQETTGGIQGIVKDPQGAVISGATIEVTSPALIGKKTATTDQGGYYRFSNLPPGVYQLSVSASGFGRSKNEGIKLEVGALPTINVKLNVGQTSESVEVTSESPAVDVTQSKTQTNVTKEILDAIPKGRSFQSLIQFAPGARNEPLQSGFQIDGASNSENSYLVEGQETAGVVHGTSNVNVPTEFIQELQVKSSGFEAEYGGALGGVVNVIQKHGSNAWHGSIFSYYSGDLFDAGPNLTERKNPLTAADSVARVDQTVEYVRAKQDQYKSVEPGFEVGGPILRDRIWGFASFIPQINTRDRTVNMSAASGFAGPFTFHQTSQVYNSFARIDALATQKIRVFGSWQYGYSRGTGQTFSTGSVLPGADFMGGQKNNDAGSPVLNFSDSQGYVAPNVLYNTGADITLTPSLVATSRFGYFFQDGQDRGLPFGVRHQYSANTTAATTALDGSLLGAQSGGAFVHNSGFSDIGANFTQIFDKTSRTSFSQDLSYFKKGFLGTHNFKAGYSLNRLWNNVNDGYNTARVRILFGSKYKVLPSDQANCTAIRATNTTTYGQPGTPDDTSCRGNWGYYMLREFGTFGQESSNNHSIYFQDAWTPGGSLNGLTINAGLRMDKETLPSYNDQPGFTGISFGFGQKLAPRIGVAYDLLHNGKVKVFGSYGAFFDIMKYNLPQGSFGGQYWHDCVYTLDTPDYTTIQPTRANNGTGHFCPPTGVGNGTNPGRFIENIDFRIPSNDPTNRLIDPNLQPMRQHETVVGVDWAITPKWSLETRYSRKRLDRTIEDAGSITPAGEQYYITNPGIGIDVQPIPVSDCASCPVQPKAKRNYDGFEIRLTRSANEKWFGTLSYTHSRLYGNYTGLTATDISDGGPLGGRNDGNSDRAFDEPFMQFDSHGKVMDGPLPTDRPNTFKAFGYYRVKWLGMETLLGATQLAYQGTPLTSYLSFEGTPVFIEGRGNFANVTRAANGDMVLNGVSNNFRTPVYTQTDFNFLHNVHLSKVNEKLLLGFEANISNVLNQHAPLLYDSAISNDDNSLAGAPATSLSGVNYNAYLTGYNYIQAENAIGNTFNSAYGKPYYYQAGRTMRFKVKFVF